MKIELSEYLGDERNDLCSEREVEMRIEGRDVVRFSEEEGRESVRGMKVLVFQWVFKVKLHVHGDEFGCVCCVTCESERKKRKRERE